MKRLLFAVLLVFGCTCAPEPVKVEPPAPVVVVKPPVKVKKAQKCIFSDGIKGCFYNDKLGRKQGHNAYKRYGDVEVLLRGKANHR